MQPSKHREFCGKSSRLPKGILGVSSYVNILILSLEVIQEYR